MDSELTQQLLAKRELLAARADVRDAERNLKNPAPPGVNLDAIARAINFKRRDNTVWLRCDMAAMIGQLAARAGVGGMRQVTGTASAKPTLRPTAALPLHRPTATTGTAAKLPTKPTEQPTSDTPVTDQFMRLTGARRRQFWHDNQRMIRAEMTDANSNNNTTT